MVRIMRHMGPGFLALFLTAVSICVHAQGAQSDYWARMRALPWVVGPSTGVISAKASVELTGLRFLEPAATDQFLEISGNLPRQNSYLLGRDDLGWWSVLDFSPEGYVKDNEKIDAAELLQQLKDGAVQAADERRRRGISVLTVDGWALAPQYDTQNNRLEWAILLHDDQNQQIVNYETKLLGRTGYITAILVSSPSTFSQDVVDFKRALTKIQYVPGERYTEFKEGDKVAAYGLGALIVGGAAAVATKKGFWAVIAGALAAGWKVVAAAAIAVIASLGRLFKKKA